jgi:hypothetical protein
MVLSRKQLVKFETLAANTNSQSETDRLAVEIKRVEDYIEADDALCEVLDFTYGQVELGSEFYAVKFLGFTCDFYYAYTLLSSLLTFYAYVISAASGSMDSVEI